MLSFIKNEQVYINLDFKTFKQKVIKNLNAIDTDEQLIFAMFKDELSVEEAVTELILIHQEPA